MSRYALYFAPAADSPWWTAGCRWLGRDPLSGVEFPQSQVPGVPHLMFAKLTSDARRYGFHATLKAPFRLMNGYSESNLMTMAEAFSAMQRPVALENVQVRAMGDFLALRPGSPLQDIDALAMRCVSFFDALRAPPTATDLAKRRDGALTARQEELLQRWGYPYTEEKFRFHMTLTDALSGVDAEAVDAIRKAAEGQFAVAQAASSLVIDALTIFREDQAGAPFSAWRRFPFLATDKDAALPAGDSCSTLSVRPAPARIRCCNG